MTGRQIWGRGSVLALVVFFFAMAGAPARAHDMDIVASFDCLGGGACAQEAEHEDAYPWKGYVNITLTNTGTEAWGDLHLAIFQVTTETVENVDWIVSAPYQPTSSQSGLTWVVDNDAVGATLDLYFYSDPVLPLETATFRVYTDNTTDSVSFFGTLFYPTPVPEPSTALLLASGLVGLAIHGRRRRA